ncbi:hypothetical protein A9Q85_06730 [Cycloclasticus sp. 44_32_T64]|nr:hypothetical protein A9Q85_06730 [Cycloclasticus sp. 44_32_T64]
MQYALCPFCLTTLQITSAQLALKSGLVRCGHCNDVFDANKNQLTPATSQALATEETEQTQHAEPPLQDQAIGVESDAPPTIAIWEVAKTKPSYTHPFGFLSFIFAITFGVQFLYIESEMLTQNVQLQPIFKKLNSAFSLHIPSYKNLEEIQIVERQLAPHPELIDTLSLQLTIKNTALAEQHFPTINVVLTSNSGEQIAHGMFTKYDYLASNETNDYFAAQALQQVNLLFQNPKKSASGFEISFQY